MQLRDAQLLSTVVISSRCGGRGGRVRGRARQKDKDRGTVGGRKWASQLQREEEKNDREVATDGSFWLGSATMINGQRGGKLGGREGEKGGRGEKKWQDSPWPARSEAGERYMDTGGWWCLGPCEWSGRGRAGGKGAPGVGDRRWRSEDEEDEDEEPQAEPSTIHPTARSNIQNSWPSWGFSLGSMAHAPPPIRIFKRE